MTTGQAAAGTPQEQGGVEPRLAQDGKLSYIQIPALDVDVSARFYADVFAWSFRPDGAAHRSFTDATGEFIGAFVTDRAISREPGVLPYIYVSRIDETVRRIEGAGGSIVRAPYPEGDLWVATFHDPAGNVMGIWQMGPREG